jgi:virulence-associated protein VapD
MILFLILAPGTSTSSMFGEETPVLVEILKSSLDQLEQLHDLAEKSGKTLDRIQQYNTAVRDIEYKFILIENLVDTTKELGQADPKSTQDILNLLHRLKGECRSIDQLLKEEREKLAESKKNDKDIDSTLKKSRFDRKVERHQLSASAHADANVAEASRQTAINTSWMLKSTNDIKDYENRQLSIMNKAYSDKKEDKSRVLAKDIETKQYYNIEHGINSKDEARKTCQFCMGGNKL